MKLRYRVNQAECFRRGIDAPKSIITIEVDPGELPSDVRNLIADRLDGIDICYGLYDRKKNRVVPKTGSVISNDGYPSNELIQADSPEYDDLIEALHEDQASLQDDIDMPF